MFCFVFLCSLNNNNINMKGSHAVHILSRQEDPMELLSIGMVMKWNVGNQPVPKLLNMWLPWLTTHCLVFSQHLYEILTFGIVFSIILEILLTTAYVYLIKEIGFYFFLHQILPTPHFLRLFGIYKKPIIIILNQTPINLHSPNMLRDQNM